MPQFDFGDLESPLNGATFINSNLEPWRDALHTTHSGNSRPTYVQAGMIWLNTTTNPWVLNLYDGADDIPFGTLNTTSHVFTASGIGTLIQAYNANLAAEAGLTGAADKISYFTGAGAKALTDFTSAARTLLAASTAALQRTALGLGSLATLSAVPDASITYPKLDTGATPQGFVNKFRNGTFEVWQRGTSISVAAGVPAYTADGWIVSPTGAIAAVAKGGQIGKSPSSLQITGNASMSATTIKQRIPSEMACSLYGQRVTFQMICWNAAGGASVTPQIIVRSCNSIDNFGAMTTNIAATNMQPIANGASGLISYTFDAPANAVNGLEIEISFGALLNANTKYIYVTDADLRLTPGVATGINTTPPIVETRPFGIEEILCKRFFQKSFQYATAPAQNAGRPGVETATSSGTASALAVNIRVRLPVRMFGSPSVTTYNPAAANNNLRNITAGSDLAVSVVDITADGFILRNNATAVSANVYEIHWSISSEQ